RHPGRTRPRGRRRAHRDARPRPGQAPPRRVRLLPRPPARSVWSAGRRYLMKVDGACHCGAIRYEAEIDPADVGICHCRDCQTLTGSAYRVAVRAPAETMRVTGTPSVYIKTADSGTKRAH